MERMKKVHTFIAAYGSLRLLIGETTEETVRSADEAVDHLVWNIYGISESDREAVLSRGYIIGANNAEEED